jgi:hypothetical protein
VIGRLKPGIDLTTAAVDTATAVDRISRTAPEVEPGRRRNAFRPNLSPLQDRISGRFRGTLALLAAAVGFLMLLVSANISNLLLARASARHKEMALRMALGAGRGRLVRQLLVESLALSCSGAALGLALAFGGTNLIAHLEGASVPLLQDVRVDGVAIVFIASVALLTGVGFGVLPALQASGPRHGRRASILCRRCDRNERVRPSHAAAQKPRCHLRHARSEVEHPIQARAPGRVDGALIAIRRVSTLRRPPWPRFCTRSPAHARLAGC